MFWNRKKSLSQSGLMKGGTDNHSHILWGVDDGVSTKEESLSILSFLEKEGLRTLWLTPHTMADVPNTTEGLKARFAQLQEAYDGPIQLHLASEYMMDENFEDHLRRKDFLYHKDGHVLVETSIWGCPVNFWDLLEEMIKEGIRPLIAHPERYLYMQPRDYDRLLAMGCHLQMNIPSLVGVYNEMVQKRAQALLSRHAYCMLGSDCHREKAIRWQYSAKVLPGKLLDPLSEITGRI